MRIFYISILIVLSITGFVYSADESNLDYYFLYNGGIFIHEEDKPYGAFEYFFIPESEPYSNFVYTADMTPEGSIIAVLKGNENNESINDLVLIDRDLKFTPLFALIKRENLDQDRKVDRTFGNIDYDPSSRKIVFSVNERISKIGAALEAEYSSKIYQIPIYGGSCETIDQMNYLTQKVTCGGGYVLTIPQNQNNEEPVKQIKYLSPGSSEWENIQILDLNLLDIDLSSDGKSLLVLGESRAIGSYNFLEVRSFNDDMEFYTRKIFYDIDELGSDYRYSFSGKLITYRQKSKAPWGEIWINHMLTSEGMDYPLVRADLAQPYSECKMNRADTIVLEVFFAQPSNNTNETETKKESLISCGVPGDTPSMFVKSDTDTDSYSLLDADFNEIFTSDLNEDSNLPNGLYFKDNTVYAIEKLELGERLISFETIPYGSLVKQPLNDDATQHDIHLAWNIGGRMTGIKVPKNGTCVGGDNNNLHIVLNYPFRGVFPASDFVTPFYFLEMENWMIEHPVYLGKANESVQFIVRSFRDEDRNLYMLDSLNSMIVKFDTKNKRTEIGCLPDNIPSLAYPSDMALFNDNLYVLDPINGRVMVFNTNGIPVKEISLEIAKNVIGNCKFGTINNSEITLIDMENGTKLLFSW